MLYLTIRPILDWMASHCAPWCCDFEHVPYKTIKKFDVGAVHILRKHILGSPNAPGGVVST